MNDLGAWASTLLRRWYWIAAGATAGVVGALLWSFGFGTHYVSCASVEVVPVLIEEVPEDAPVRRFVNMDNELAVIEGRGVLADASRRFGGPIEQDSLTTRVAPNSEVLRVCYSGSGATQAAAGVDAILMAYQDARATAVADELAARLQATERERTRVAADLRASLVTGEDPVELVQRYDELSAQALRLSEVSSAGSLVVQPPTPAVVDQQERRLELASGLAIGILLAFPIAVRGASAPRESPA